jgi:hypothetical protein
MDDAGAVQERRTFERILSPNVSLRYGFKDAHAVLRVRLPVIVIWWSQEVPAETIFRLKPNFDQAYEYGRRPAHERTMTEPVEFEARSDCRGRWGWPDAHVELGVWKLKWFWIDFRFEEFVLAKEAMDEAYLWAQLPEHVREMQGAP